MSSKPALDRSVLRVGYANFELGLVLAGSSAVRVDQSIFGAHAQPAVSQVWLAGSDSPIGNH